MGSDVELRNHREDGESHGLKRGGAHGSLQIYCTVRKETAQCLYIQAAARQYSMFHLLTFYPLLFGDFREGSAARVES